MKKRFIFTIVLAIFMALTFMSCGLLESDVIGTWKQTEAIYGTQVVTTPSGSYNVIEFRSGGVGRMYFVENGKKVAQYDITWSISKKNVEIAVEQYGMKAIVTAEVDGYEMTMRLENSYGEKFTAVFYKQ